MRERSVSVKRGALKGGVRWQQEKVAEEAEVVAVVAVAAVVTAAVTAVAERREERQSVAERRVFRHY